MARHAGAGFGKAISGRYQGHGLDIPDGGARGEGEIPKFANVSVRPRIFATPSAAEAATGRDP
jgi:hypothetical protein